MRNYLQSAYPYYSCGHHVVTQVTPSLLCAPVGKAWSQNGSLSFTFGDLTTGRHYPFQRLSYLEPNLDNRVGDQFIVRQRSGVKCHQDFLPNRAHRSLSWCSHTTLPNPQLSVTPSFTHGPWSLKGIQHPCTLAVSTHCSDDLSSTHHTPSHPLAPLTGLNLTVPHMFQRLAYFHTFAPATWNALLLSTLRTSQTAQLQWLLSPSLPFRLEKKRPFLFYS